MSKNSSHWPLTLLGGATSLIQLVLPLFLVRLLPEEAIGQYKIFFLYLVLAPWLLMTGGINNGLAHWAGHGDIAKRTYQASWTLLVGAAVLTAFGGVLFAPWLGEAFGWTPTDATIFALCAGLLILGPFFEDATVARGEVMTSAIFSSGFDLFRNLAILAVAYFTRDVRSVFIAFGASLALKVLAGLIQGRKSELQKFCFDREIHAKVLKYALPVSFSSALSILTNYADQLILSRSISTAEFAVYSIGCLVIPPLMIFEQSVNRVLTPNLSRALNGAQAPGATPPAKLYRDSVRELAWLILPAVAGMMVFAKPFMLLLFTEKFADAVPFFRMQVISYLCFIIPMDALARARGNSKWILRNLIWSAALSLVLILGSARLFGPMGALLATVGVHLLMRGYTIIWIRGSEGWAWGEFLPLGKIARFTATALALSLASLAIRPAFTTERWWMFATAPVFLLIYLALTMEPSRWSQMLAFRGRLKMGTLRTSILLLAGASTIASIVQAEAADHFQVGSEWDKYRLTVLRYRAAGPITRKAAQALGRAGGSTAFYIGKHNGVHLMATNWHVYPNGCQDDLIRFPFLDKEFACAYLVASWPEIDTSIFAIRVPRASEAALQRRALKFAFRGDVYPGQRLLTIGYGGHRNPFLKPMVDLGPDCRVFSGRNDFRFKLEPEYFETDRMQVWSLAHGCEASPGDSGSAILDRVTGEVVAILWATTPGRSARVQDTSYLSSLLENPNDDVWEQLNYAAPALKIFETINATIAVPSDFMDLDRRNTLRALIGMPPEMPGQDPIPDPTPEPTEEPLPEPTDAPAPTEPPVEPVEVPNPPTPTEDPPVVVEPVEPLPPIEPIEVPSTAPSPAPEDQPITAPNPLPLRLPEES